jgi:hypothetical protein
LKHLNDEPGGRPNIHQPAVSPCKPHALFRARAKLASCFSACILTACAAQGPPTPPRIEKPEPITDLAVTQVGRTLEVSFTPPTLAADGERLSKPMEIEIFRSAGVRGGKLPVNTGSQVPWVTLEPDEWMALLRSQSTVLPTLPVSGVTVGRRYTPVRGPGRRSDSTSSEEEGTRAPGRAGLMRRKRRAKNRAANLSV